MLARPRASPFPVVAIAVAAFAPAIFALYPGYYTFDSAYQLYQARTGEYHSLQPPLSEAVKHELMLRWLCLPFTHGAAWLRHRLEVARSVFGVRRAGEPEGLAVGRKR